MTTRRFCDLLTDVRWTEDDSSGTHLRNPVTMSWVEMIPPVPLEALVYQEPGDFWRRFGDWCMAAFQLGHCDPSRCEAGPLLNGNGGWIVEPRA